MDGANDLGSLTAIELRRSFRAPAARVFQAWTHPAALRSWWSPPGWTVSEIAIDLRVGGAYSIAMRRLDGSGAAAVQGQFIEVRPPERLVFTWRWEGALAGAGETRVTLELRETGAITELVLRHERFAAPALAHQHWSGWLAACGRLDSLLGAPAMV
jgi:uncharacterized protein YndB with AHSA1/START domain